MYKTVRIIIHGAQIITHRDGIQQIYRAIVHGETRVTATGEIQVITANSKGGTLMLI